MFTDWMAAIFPSLNGDPKAPFAAMPRSLHSNAPRISSPALGCPTSSLASRSLNPGSARHVVFSVVLAAADPADTANIQLVQEHCWAHPTQA
jgi:hypothetical protein